MVVLQQGGQMIERLLAVFYRPSGSMLYLAGARAFSVLAKAK